MATNPVELEDPPVGAGRKALIVIFLLSLLTPIAGDLGTLRMTPYTAVLLVLFFPMLFMWMGRKHSPIILPDVLVMLFCLWSATAVIYNHGFELTTEAIGIQTLQTLGAYLLGRMLIRDHRSMRFMVATVTIALGIMLPFVIMESVTGVKMILRMASVLGNTFPDVVADKRWGLSRAQGAFEHPILMGTFCASVMSLAFYVWQGKGNFFLRKLAAPVAVVSSMLSLSTGALLSLNAQFGLMAWGRIFRDNPARWKVLSTLLASMYIAVDVISNRTPFHVFVTYATFNQTSSYNRILIWQYGSAEALRHPFFGIGFGEWERPSFMSGSMDNFWLVQAVRYGIPAFLMLAGALIIITKRIGAAQLPTESLRLARQGMVFSLIGFATAIISVHLWNASYVWFCFLMGACAWPMFIGGENTGSQQEAGTTQAQASRGRESLQKPSLRKPPLRKGR